MQSCPTFACGTWIGLYGYPDDGGSFVGIDSVTPLFGDETPSATGLAYLDPTIARMASRNSGLEGLARSSQWQRISAVPAYFLTQRDKADE